MLKVCFISTKAYPLFNPKSETPHGGAELQVAYLAKELAKQEMFEVTCIVGNFGQPRHEVRDGVYLKRAFNPRGHERLSVKLKQSLKYWRLLRRLRPHVVITTTAGPAALIAALYARATRTKHIHRTAHDRDVDLSFMTGKGLKHFVYVMGIQMADAVITQSEAHKRALKQYGRSASVLRNVFPAEARTPLPFENRDIVLWVGRYVDFKQPEKFLKLCDAVPDVSFVMICQAGADRKGAYQEFLRKADVIPNLEVLPNVPFESIGAYFQRAVALVSTSTAEGFPNTFLQAFSAGTPVISLDVNPDGIFERYSLGTHCKGSFDRLIAEVERIYENKAHWESVRRDTHFYLKEWHDPVRNAEVLRNTITNLYSSESRGGTRTDRE